MATAEANVANVALVRVGHTKLLENLDGTDVTSRTCKALLAHTRDMLLQARPWKFATLRRVLSASNESRSGWAYVYTLPADCLMARYIWGGVDAPTKGQEIPFRIESSRDLQGRVLITNYEAAELVYTAKVTEVPRWDPLFTEAVAMKMASDLAFGLAKKPALGAELARAFYIALGAAGAADGGHGQPSPSPVSEFESGRF